jgi:hypothetical protein
MSPSSCTRFELEKHNGPYEKWPLKSRLIVDGALTDVRVTGYSLLHQFEIPNGFLLVTDYDCPFEESTNFTLLSRELRVISRRSIGGAYCSFLLDKIEWLDDRNLIAVFYQDDRWKISIGARGIPYLRPRISAKRMT